MTFRSRSAVLLVLVSICANVRAADWLVLSNFSLIDGTGASERSVQSLTIRDGVIVDIDGASTLEPPAAMDSTTSIDLGSAYVMPGLIDTHVHVARFPETRTEAERILQTAVRGGITGVRDLGGDARALGEIVRAMRRREFVGPTVVYAAMYGGPTLFADQRITELAFDYPPGEAPWTKAVSKSTDLRVAIAETKGAGATGVKIYGNLDARLVGKIIKEAHRQELATWAHATVFPAGPGQLVDAGIDSLSHAPYLVWEAASSIPDDYSARTDGPWSETPPDHPKILALFDKMARKGVFLDATLYVYQQMHTYSPEVQADWTGEALEWATKVTGIAHNRGVPLTAGTDWFEPRDERELPHTHEELALLVELAGLSPMDAIIAGTRNGAAAIGMLDTRGTIEIGKAADLLVLEESPLANIRNTTKIRLVVKDGVIVRPERHQ